MLKMFGDDLQRHIPYYLFNIVCKLPNNLNSLVVALDNVHIKKCRCCSFKYVSYQPFYLLPVSVVFLYRFFTSRNKKE